MKAPIIFHYTDFKEFLRDWRVYEKSHNSGFTHDYLAEKLGVKNRGYFNDLERGRRTVGDDMLDRLILLLGLAGTERKYFRALVGYNQPSTPLQKEYWFEQLILLNHTPKKIVEKDTYEFYRHWYYNTVRAYLDVYDLSDGYEEASKRLLERVSAKQVRESVQVLSKLGLIQKNEVGFWKPVDKVLSTGDAARGELIRQFQLSNHKVLEQILSENTQDSHNSAQLTLSLSEVGLNRVKERMKQFRKEILAIAAKDEDRAALVYKVSLHGYAESESSEC